MRISLKYWLYFYMAVGLCSFAESLYAQHDSSSLIDDYKIKIAANQGEEKALAMSQLAFTYMLYGQFDDALAYADSSQAMAQNEDWPDVLALSHSAFGSIYDRLGRLEEALFHFRKVLQYNLAIGDEEVAASVYYELGQLMVKYGTLHSAVDTINIALDLFKARNQPKKQGLCYNTLGVIYSQLGQPEEALNFQNKAVELVSQFPTSRNLPNLYCTQAARLMHLNRLDEAEKSLKEAMQLCVIGDLQFEKTNVLLHQAQLLLKQNQSASALIQLEECAQLCKKLGSESDLMQVYHFQSQAFAQREMWSLALESAELAEAYVESNQNPYLPIDHLKQLALCQEKTGAVESALATRKRLEQEIHHRQDRLQLQQARDLEAQFKTQEQKRTIAAQEQQLQISQTEVEKARLKNQVAWGSAVALLLLSLAGWMWYRQRLKTQEQSAKIELNQSLLANSELERERIARELHDSTGSMLTGVKLSLENLKDAIPEGNLNQKVGAQIEQVVQLGKEVRRVSHAMAPAAIDISNFGDVLNDLIAPLGELKRPEVLLDIRGNFNLLQKQQKTMLYRILQECLNNSLKHAAADEIQILLHQEGEVLQVIYQDDGKGFDLDVATAGLGLSGLEQRITFLGGKAMMHSEVGEGFVLRFSMQH